VIPEEIIMLFGKKSYFQKCKKALDKDPTNPHAQYNLGLCYMKGKGVDRDKWEAANLYKLAAEQEFVPAQRSLAECYLYGNGVEKDVIEAKRLYRLVAEKKPDDPWARKDLENAISLLKMDRCTILTRIRLAYPDYPEAVTILLQEKKYLDPTKLEDKRLERYIAMIKDMVTENGDTLHDPATQKRIVEGLLKKERLYSLLTVETMAASSQRARILLEFIPAPKVVAPILEYIDFPEGEAAMAAETSRYVNITKGIKITKIEMENDYISILFATKQECESFFTVSNLENVAVSREKLGRGKFCARLALEVHASEEAGDISHENMTRNTRDIFDKIRQRVTQVGEAIDWKARIEQQKVLKDIVGFDMSGR
jgi:hypothetical protein